MIEELVDYYESLATKSKHIQSFVRMDVNELLAMTGESTIQYPCMCLEVMTGQLAGTGRDNANTVMTAGFAILERVAEGDYAAEVQTLDRTLNIGLQVLARMDRDRHEGSIPALLEMNPDDTKWEQIGPVADNAFGILFKVKTTHPVDMDVNPADWNE